MGTGTHLAADTSMGAVTLNVADLDGMTVYYRDGVGLAAAVYSVARMRPGSFTGSSDHLVSKAFYFDDPEGNGVELYWDRDRTQWSWTHGQVEMGVLSLDPNAYLREHLDERGLAGESVGDARVGHIHPSVGDVRTARDFYATRLGFDVTLALGDQAVFVSAGGYHHHMAMNVWKSRGAGRRQPALGLGRVDIEVPSANAVRLSVASHPKDTVAPPNCKSGRNTSLT